MYYNLPYCIKIHKSFGEAVLSRIKNDIMDKKYKVSRIEDYILIPIRNIDEAKKILSEMGIEFQFVECVPEERKSVDLERIPSYDLIGDVVIVRSKVLEEYSPEEIVSIIKKLHPKIKAIYVKEATETDYRISKLRLLWGTDLEKVYTKEYGLRFAVLLKKVYYNPRLAEEHRRIAEMVRDHEMVFDLFTGIGGFAIHIAALKKATIIANDINPYAIMCLIENMLLNKKILRGTIIVSLNDAKRVVDVVKPRIADRIIANLPHNSLEFIDTYNYLAKKKTILHLYLIASNEDDVLRKLNESELTSVWDIIGLRKVLDYAPYKFIYRVDLMKS